MVAFIRKRKSTRSVSSGRVAKKPRMTAKRVASIAKKAVMKASETKKHSDELIEQSFNFATIVDRSLVNLGQGTGNSARIGHKVNSVGFDVRGHINTATGSAYTIVKMMLVRFKDNEANPALDLLETNTANATVTGNDVSSLWRRTNTDLYEVLKTKYISIHPDRPHAMFKFWVPYKRTLTYDGGATSEPTNNRVHLICYAREVGNDGGNPNIELHYVSTMYYKDP